MEPVVGGCGYKGAVGAVIGGGLQEVGVATEPYIEYILPPSLFPLQEERPPLPSLTTKVEAFKVQYTSS